MITASLCCKLLCLRKCLACHASNLHARTCMHGRQTCMHGRQTRTHGSQNVHACLVVAELVDKKTRHRSSSSITRSSSLTNWLLRTHKAQTIKKMRGFLNMGRTGVRKSIAPVRRLATDNYAFDDPDDDADAKLPNVVEVRTMHGLYKLWAVARTVVVAQDIEHMALALAEEQRTHSNPFHPVQQEAHQEAQQEAQPEPATGTQASTLQCPTQARRLCLI